MDRVHEGASPYGKAAALEAYESRLRADFDYALKEGSMYFNQRSEVHKALSKITSRLAELQIDYALADGMALFVHGYQRFTDDIDLLVTSEGLKRIHAELEGRGYLPPFAGSKSLRDTENGVKIEFLVTGGFPGDGKPKPVAFPDPAHASTRIHDLQCLTLEALIELKLASGMTNVARAHDLGDVIALIRERKLDAAFAPKLNPYVRPKFLELVEAVRAEDARGEI
jgi:hypothetical protein